MPATCGPALAESQDHNTHDLSNPLHLPSSGQRGARTGSLTIFRLNELWFLLLGEADRLPVDAEKFEQLNRC